MANRNSVAVAMKAGVILLVQADADLMDLIDGNIFSQSLAEHTVENSPAGFTYPRIHMRIVGGSAPQEAWGELNKQNLIVQCWSKEDYDEAWYVNENFIRVVNGQTVDSLAEGTFDYKVTNPGQEVFDPTQTLYYIVSQFRVNMIRC